VPAGTPHASRTIERPTTCPNTLAATQPRKQHLPVGAVC